MLFSKFVENIEGFLQQLNGKVEHISEFIDVLEGNDEDRQHKKELLNRVLTAHSDYKESVKRNEEKKKKEKMDLHVHTQPPQIPVNKPKEESKKKASFVDEKPRAISGVDKRPPSGSVA